MENIKYEALLGDQDTLNEQPNKFVEVKLWHDLLGSNFVTLDELSELSARGKIPDNTVIVAMRRIIRTPTWTTADKEAGRLPEVGCRVAGGKIAFVNSFNVVTELESGAVIVSSPKTFLNTFNPIESPEEKAARLEYEWVESAIYETVKRKDVTNDEYERLKIRLGDVYNALLTGDLPVPVKE